MNAKTQRERDYIDALAAMYVDYDKVDHRTRVQNYLKAQEQVAQRYPKDDEAQIAYAITLNVAASPDRQDLRQPAQGCGAAGADLQAAAAASRRRALSDSSL